MTIQRIRVMAETNPQFSDEMISAYLDGELSPEQRRLVERVMQEDPECRKLYEQLKALHDSVRQMPSEQLDAEFADRVLKRIRAVQDPSPHDADKVDAVSTIQDAHTPRHGYRRGLFWAALAIATAVLLMVLQPPAGLEDGRVAKAPANEADGKVDAGEEAGRRAWESASADRAPNFARPDVVADAPSSGPTSQLGRAIRRQKKPPTVLRADVTTEQLDEILRRVREDRLNVTGQRQANSTPGSFGSTLKDADDATADLDKSGTAGPPENERLILVDASIEEVRRLLHQVSVQTSQPLIETRDERGVAANGRDRFDRDGGADASKLSEVDEALAFRVEEERGRGELEMFHSRRSLDRVVDNEKREVEGIPSADSKADYWFETAAPNAPVQVASEKRGRVLLILRVINAPQSHAEADAKAPNRTD